ncbi:hypothetical protein [Flagellimonas meridianipacifica]|uniref:Membrane metalloprotease n=1 Tax=Flagellimonas meridianipacifica TaxID=1080225 RepID=A0A2T0M8K9_9FLAO|nr:hypothetical protein [Allomuricauda pacifica]PRX53762.1 hypothetical protein CLV81_2149 [Allomuricauda pacifica]
MKKKNLFLLLVLLGLFIGCSSDSDTSEIPPNSGTGTPAPPPPNVDRSGNLLATGASANDLLANTNFDRIQVEIAHQPGFRPTAETISNFQDFVRLHSFKEDIEIIFNQFPSPNQETLTLQQIDSLEQANRTAFNNGRTLAVYIYFANAPSDEDDEEESTVTLGAVFRNTSMVIFESTIRELAPPDNSGAPVTLTDVETATLNHEFGHLFGLVNLGTEPINDHEDMDAPNHCNVPGCLMQARLEFGSPAARGLVALTEKGETLSSACTLDGNALMKILQDRTLARTSDVVPLLDDECILDLQGNGGR